MFASIDPTARIESGAVIGEDVSIGPYCVIGPNVTIETGCKLLAHVHVAGHTTLGSGSIVYPFASLGTPPQSVKYKGGPTKLVIGPNCEIREHVTMNTGTEEAGGLTEVGARCLFMVGAHVAHDCHVGNDVTLANNATLGGHVIVGDNVFFGGLSAVLISGSGWLPAFFKHVHRWIGVHFGPEAAAWFPPPPWPDPVVMLQAALQEAAKAANVGLTIENGAIFLQP